VINVFSLLPCCWHTLPVCHCLLEWDRGTVSGITLAFSVFSRHKISILSKLTLPLSIFLNGILGDYGYIFLGPRGRSVTNPGPVILDAGGNVVWVGTQFDQATDVKVQRYRGQDYLTFC
jgi:hypothetical protein